MPKITIVHPYEWVNQKKKIKVFIDDQQVGQVGIEESVCFDVSPGKHTLMVKDTWPSRSKSLEVDFGDNQDKTINISTFKRRFWAPFLIALFTGFGYSMVRSLFNIESTWILDISVWTSMFVVLLIILSTTRFIKLEVEVDKKIRDKN